MGLFCCERVKKNNRFCHFRVNFQNQILKALSVFVCFFLDFIMSIVASESNSWRGLTRAASTHLRPKEKQRT